MSEWGQTASVPWEKLPEDSPRSFHAFQDYRDLPPWSRSIDAAYQVHLERCLGKKGAENSTKTAPRHWRDWSAANRWVERAQQYDAHQSEERRQRRAWELDEALDNQETVGRLAMSRAVAALNAMGRNPEGVPPSLIPQLLKVGAEMQLRALGYNEKHSVELSGPGGGPIPLEPVAIQKLLANPEARKALETLSLELAKDPEEPRPSPGP